MKSNTYLTNYITDRIPPTSFNIRSGDKNTLASMWNEYFKYCLASNSIIYFPEGEWYFPDAYTFDFGSENVIMLGDSKEKTIFKQQKYSSSFEIPKRIDLTKAPTESGYFTVDVKPHSAHAHSSFSNIINDVELGNYIYVADDMTTRIVLLTEIKSRNLITPINIETPPEIDGLYVVSTGVDLFGGGFGFTPWTTPSGNIIRVINGSIVKREGGVWSIFNPPRGFRMTGNVHVENISFYDWGTPIFDIVSKDKSRDFLLKECNFEFCWRVFAHELNGSFSESGALYPLSSGNIPNETEKNRNPYCFEKFTIKDCSFSYIHQAILWGIPPSKKIEINNNTCKNCYTCINFFFPASDTNNGVNVAKAIETRITDNSFIDCINEDYLGGGTNSARFIQFEGESSYVARNTFKNTYGIHFYINNGDSIITDNYIEQYITNGLALGECIFLYKNQHKADGKQINSNNIVNGATCAIIYTQQSYKIFLENNMFRNFDNMNYFLSSTTGLDKRKSYLIYDNAALTQFQTIAGTNLYDPAITHSVRVYWERREHKWKTLTSVYPYICSNSTLPYQMDGLYLKNCYLESRILFQMAIAIETIVMDGCEVRDNAALINSVGAGDQIKSLSVLNSTINRIAGSACFVHGDLEFQNNILNCSVGASGWEFRSGAGNVVVNGNTFKFYTKIGKLAPTNPNFISMRGIKNVTANNNNIIAENGSQTVFNIINAKDLYINNNYIEVDRTGYTGNDMFLIVLPTTPYDILKLISVNNNTINIKNNNLNRTFLHCGASAVFSDVQCVITNNKFVGYDPTVFYDTNLNAKLLKFIAKDNTFDKKIYYKSDSFGTATTVVPGSFKVNIILDSDTTIDEHTINIPSTFLIDQQTIEISCPVEGVTSLTLSSAAHMVGEPTEIAAGETIKGVYSIEATTWFFI